MSDKARRLDTLGQSFSSSKIKIQSLQKWLEYIYTYLYIKFII